MENRPSLVKDEKGLTDRQRKFAELWVKARVNKLKVTDAELAKAAGYSGTKLVLEAAASRTLNTEAVLRFIHEAARNHLREGVLDLALEARRLSDPAHTPSDRIRADMVGRLLGGLGVVQDQGAMGGGVAIQLVFATQAGAMLAQPPQPLALSVPSQRLPDPIHSLPQGDGDGPDATTAPATPRRARSPGQRKGGAGGGGGDFSPRGAGEGGSPSNRPPENLEGGRVDCPKIFRSGKSSGVRSGVRKVAKVAKAPRVVKAKAPEPEVPKLSRSEIARRRWAGMTAEQRAAKGAALRAAREAKRDV